MRQTSWFVLISFLGGLVATAPTLAQSEEAARIKTAIQVLQEIKDAPDAGVPKWVAEKAQGIAVFPSVKKGGLWWLAYRERDGKPQVVVRAAVAPDLL